MINKIEVQQYKILQYLNRGMKSTSDIGNYINLNYYQTLSRLGDLLTQKKIKKIIKSRGTYWELKK